MILSSLRRNLYAKVTLAIAFPLLLILGVFTIIEYSRHQESMLGNLSLLAAYSGEVIESYLQHAMLTSDFAEVQVLFDTVRRNGDFSALYLLDTSGKVIFAPEERGVGLVFSPLEPNCQPCHSLPVDARPRGVVVTGEDGQQVFRSMHPIENQPACSRCHDPNKRLLGLLLTDISTVPMSAALEADLRTNALWRLGAILATIVVVNVVLRFLVLKRLGGLNSAIAGLGKGRLPPPLPEAEPDAIGHLAAAFNLMARRVATREAENRDLAASLNLQSNQRGELLKQLITAQEDERKRVARELHDELGQYLSGLALRAQALERFISSDTPHAVERLREIQGLTSETTERMHELILDLRPSALDDLGLAAALRQCGERLLAPSNIAFELHASSLSERLPQAIETALYRIFQEALTNVVRHARASQVQITLAQYDGVFEGEIADDGHGFDPGNLPTTDSRPRLGLLGIQERIAQCGGHLDIISEPGRGTRLHIRVPLTGGTAVV